MGGRQQKAAAPRQARGAWRRPWGRSARWATHASRIAGLTPATRLTLRTYAKGLGRRDAERERLRALVEGAGADTGLAR
jgi:hypothetical protein